MTTPPEITHEGLCSVDGCPFPDDEGEWHTPWCQAIKGHRCFGNATHQHWPKKGMGGHNPESKIVACLCAGAHDRIDNSPYWGNAVLDVPGIGKVYRIWQVKDNATLLERVIEPRKEADEMAGEFDGDLDMRIHMERDLNLSLSKDEGSDTLPALALGEIRLPTAPTIVSVTLPVFPRGVTPNLMGLQFDDLVTYEEWAAIGPQLALLGDWLPWAVGDWLKHGQWAYGEKYAQAASETGLKEERLVQYQWVAEKVENQTRVRFSALHWTHFREVAALPAPQQTEWLQRAQDEGLTTRQLHDCVARHREPQAECEHEWMGKVVCKLCGAEGSRG